MHPSLRAGMIACALLAGIGTATAAESALTAARSSAVSKPQLSLSQEQSQAVVQAVNSQDTQDKLPPGFAPQVGGKVPSQKKLPLHPLPPGLVQAHPELANYYYGKLERNVLIVDPMRKTVVAMIPR